VVVWGQDKKQQRARLTGAWTILWEGECRHRSKTSQNFARCYLIVQGNRYGPPAPGDRGTLVMQVEEPD
jgi:hypothetical protein